MNRLTLAATTIVLLTGVVGLCAPVRGAAAASGATRLDEEADRRSKLVVSGVGEVQRKPDFATITVGFEGQEATARAASAKAGAAIEAIGKAINALPLPGEKQIQTGSVDLAPVYDPQPVDSVGRPTGQPKLSGYRASSTMQIRTADAKSIGVIIDAATGAGANRIFGVSFGLKEALQAREEAIRLAAASAAAKAETLAGALRLKIDGVLTATTSDPDQGRFYGRNMTANMAQAEGGFSEAIEPGMVTVRAEVSVTYLISAKQ